MMVFLVLSVSLCALLSAFTGALAYALRDFSRPQLEAILEAQGKSDRLRPLLDHQRDFTLLAASLRLVTILFLLGGLLQLANYLTFLPGWAHYAAAISAAALISTIFSVGLASSVANYFGEHLIARLDPVLHALRAVFFPLLAVLHAIDAAVFRLSPAARKDATEIAEQAVEEEILAVVEEGEKDGVVDEHYREMIESVMQFRDTTAGQIMTARPDIVALPIGCTLEQLVQQIETSGHSRLPIYDRDLDHIAGILYARDLITILGDPELRARFDLAKCLRQPTYIPETKNLQDLLREFRLRKIHLAIVLDEFGGTAGLVTIEDVLEELVGEISDEHEPTAPPALYKVDESTWDVDARTYIDEVNAVIGLSIPEDQGYDTLGGYVSSLLGRIPESGEEFTTPLTQGQGDSVAHWKILDAEPTRINRVRLLLRAADPAPAESSTDPRE